MVSLKGAVDSCEHVPSAGCVGRVTLIVVATTRWLARPNLVHPSGRMPVATAEYLGGLPGELTTSTWLTVARLLPGVSLQAVSERLRARIKIVVIHFLRMFIVFIIQLIHRAGGAGCSLC